MGADTVIFAYGLRYDLGRDSEIDDGELEALEMGTDARIIAAQQAGLQCWWGRDTDGGSYHLIVGHIVGVFGIENDSTARLPQERLLSIASEVRPKLLRAGSVGEPSFHVQFEAQY